ncbi:MAG: PIN domain-containing protein [Gordonia sp. (in: high G+C Gram-positive bacteria)]
MLNTLPTDYDDAAALYRACRRQGETVRKLLDCFIASHAIREGIPLLYADRDFDALARCTALALDTP